MQNKHIHLNLDTKCYTLNTWGNLLSLEQKCYCCSSSAKCICKKCGTNAHLLQTGMMMKKGPTKIFRQKQKILTQTFAR